MINRDLLPSESQAGETPDLDHLCINTIRTLCNSSRLCHDTYSAHQGVEHDNMNLLVLGARVIGQEMARELVRCFVLAEFTNEDRHCRRLARVAAIEQRYRTQISECMTAREA